MIAPQGKQQKPQRKLPRSTSSKPNIGAAEASKVLKSKENCERAPLACMSAYVIPLFSTTKVSRALISENSASMASSLKAKQSAQDANHAKDVPKNRSSVSNLNFITFVLIPSNYTETLALAEVQTKVLTQKRGVKIEIGHNDRQIPPLASPIYKPIPKITGSCDAAQPANAALDSTLLPVK